MALTNQEKDELRSITREAFSSIGDNIKNALENALDPATTLGGVLEKDILKSLRQAAQFSEKIASNEERLKSGLLKNKDIQNQLLSIGAKEKSMQDIKYALLSKGVGINSKIIQQIDESTQYYEVQKNLLEDQTIEIERQEKSLGLTGKLIQGISKIPVLGNLISAEKALGDVQLAAAKKGSTKLSVIGAGFKSLGKSAVEGLTDPLTLMTAIFNAANKADKQTTELAKSLGIGKDQANGLRENFVKYANSTGDAFITTNKLLEAQGELTNELGIAVQYTGKQTEDFTRLTKLIGLSASEAGKLARLSIINGTSIEATTKSIIKGSAASQRSNKISIDQRTILKDVANLSAGILVKFQGNPEALGAAVVQARALGLTLEEVDKIGESLLNFESSIENELKAELITGKQLNLERARAAALTGDQAALMQEVASQTGTLAEFQDMNVIAQKSLAEAFGLSRDEVSKMLIEQEKVNKLGDVSKMTLDQQLEALKAQGEPLDSVLYKQIQQQSAQEKFNQAIEKLSDMVGNLVAGPFGRLLDIISAIAQQTKLMAAIIGVYVGKLILVNALKLQEFIISKKVARSTAAAAAAEAAKSTAMIPVVGGILAAGAAIALFASLSGLFDKGDDVVSKGYGKRMLLDKGSITAFNNDDTIIAGTNLGGGSSGFDISPLVSAINEVRNAVNALANKPQQAIALHVGPEKLGEIVGRQAETGTNQYQNAYQLA
jgi:hypothetical protein